MEIESERVIPHVPDGRCKLQVQIPKRQLDSDREYLAALHRRLNRTAETVERSERALRESRELLGILSSMDR
jgi:hypothetical protein